ncbi:Tn3 family transposase [Streptomyces smyrnaeus]|uniref:Tn3 family transposase n=1 Tax=Streptomyces smyrnaeus TaxID=1387713 RepID=UPI0036C9E2F0
MRHCTDMDVDRQYPDTHGASIVGFAFAHRLDFELMPRLKNIGSAKLYRPAVGGRGGRGLAARRTPAEASVSAESAGAGVR